MKCTSRAKLKVTIQEKDFKYGESFQESAYKRSEITDNATEKYEDPTRHQIGTLYGERT